MIAVPRLLDLASFANPRIADCCARLSLLPFHHRAGATPIHGLMLQEWDYQLLLKHIVQLDPAALTRINKYIPNTRFGCIPCIHSLGQGLACGCD